jgi:hypothetical protein
VLFLAAVLVAHDAVLLPVTIAAGALLARFAPRWILPSIRVAAIMSLAVGVVALPLVLGFGRAADNPSILPLAYGRGLLLILVLTWVVVLAPAVLTRLRSSRPGSAEPSRRSGRPGRSDQQHHVSHRSEDDHGHR